MDIRLAHLRTLREVGQRGSFSKAGEALRLSQPAVSLHVRELERAFGLSLLERVGKRAFPTAAGNVLLAHAARIFDEIDAARNALLAMRGTVAGRVRLGASATASIYLLPPLLRRIRKQNPGVELVVVTGNAPDIVKAVVDNTLDLAVATLPATSRELEVTPFYADRLVAIAPPEPRWRGRRHLTPAELAAMPLILYERGGAIRRIMDAWFARAGRAPNIAMELGNAEATKKMVGAGLGLSIVSAVAVRREVREGELVAIPLNPPLVRELGIIRRRDKPSTPAFTAVFTVLHAFAGRRCTRADR